MANTGFKGFSVRQTGGKLLFRSFKQLSTGALCTTGTTNLYMMELQDTPGTTTGVKTYDFASTGGTPNQFTAATVTTEALAMTYCKSNNGATDTGLYTAVLSTLTGFTVGAVYIVRVNNPNAFPTDEMWEFQYGSEEGDLQVTQGATGVGYLQTDPEYWKGTVLPAAVTAGYVQVDMAEVLPTSPAINTLGEALFIADNLVGRINTAQAGSSNTITLDAGASGTDGRYVGYSCYLYGGTGGGVRGVGQDRTIIGYVGSTKVATLAQAWGTNPDATSKFMLYTQPFTNVGIWSGTAVATPATAGIPEVNVKNINNVATTSVTTVNANQGTSQPVNSTGTAGSALVQVDTRDFLGHAVVLDGNNYPCVNIVDIAGTASAGTPGYIGPDWGHVNAPTTTVGLTGTTISTSQAVASVSGAVGSVNGLTNATIATAILTDTTSSDFATVGSPGHIMVTQLGGAFTGSGSVFTVASLVNAPTGGSAPTVAQIATGIWQDLATGSDFTTPNSIGALLVGDLTTSLTTINNSVLAVPAALLKVDWTTISGEANYSVLNALRALRNHWDTTGAYHVYKEDGATVAWTRTITATSGAAPITALT